MAGIKICSPAKYFIKENQEDAGGKNNFEAKNRSVSCHEQERKSQQTFGCVSSIGLVVVSRERLKYMVVRARKKAKEVAGQKKEVDVKSDRAGRGWKRKHVEWSGALVISSCRYESESMCRRPSQQCPAVRCTPPPSWRSSGRHHQGSDPTAASECRPRRQTACRWRACWRERQRGSGDPG